MKYSLFLLLSFALVYCKSSNHAKDAAPAASASETAATTPNAELVGTYWKLTELNGQPVGPDTTGGREPHMILQSSDTTVRGNGGCNGFGGNYEWKEPNRIKFDKIVSTMMACERLETENRFFEVLRMADNYYIVGDTLILNKAKMAPLARFTAVYLK
ncbi:MAG: META domain-containing protein [Chitinophagaceae bacterium]|nr:META domain-containing protein [Chitinophagaceae bacterium]